MAKSFKELSDQAKQVASKVSGDAKSLKGRQSNIGKKRNGQLRDEGG